MGKKEKESRFETRDQKEGKLDLREGESQRLWECWRDKGKEIKGKERKLSDDILDSIKILNQSFNNFTGGCYGGSKSLKTNNHIHRFLK